MRQLMDMTKAAIAMATLLIGVYVLMSIPGVGMLFFILFAVICALGLVGMTLARVVKLSASRPRRESVTDENTFELSAGMRPMGAS